MNVFPGVIKFAEPSWRLLLHLVWGSWWGGICFYALVVVPIGTEAIGSVEQGFITQQVSRSHNVLTVVLLVCLAIESLRLKNASIGILTTLLFINVLVLLAWHSRLSGMMNFRDHDVPPAFYGQHAIYLWMTASEWLLGIVIPAFLFRSARPVGSPS